MEPEPKAIPSLNRNSIFGFSTSNFDVPVTGLEPRNVSGELSFPVEKERLPS